MHLSESWSTEKHLWQTLQETLMDLDCLQFMEIPMGSSQRATRALHLSWLVVAKRGITLSKHSVAPECYAKCLLPGAVADDVVNKKKIHHENILKLENATLPGFTHPFLLFPGKWPPGHRHLQKASSRATIYLQFCIGKYLG